MVITITPIGCCVALKIAKKLFISAHQSIPECFYQCIGGRWMDCRIAHNLPFAILPILPFCHFARCPLMQMVNLGPKCALSNYNFLIGLQIKSAPQTIMGIVRVKWSIMTWHHHILTKQELIWLLTRLNFGFLNRTVKSIPESQISRRPKNSSTDFNICYLFDKFYPGVHKCNAPANALALTSKWDDLLHQIVIQSTISMPFYDLIDWIKF